MISFDLSKVIRKLDKSQDLIQTESDREAIAIILSICDELEKGKRLYPNVIQSVFITKPDARSKELQADGVNAKVIAEVLKAESEIRSQYKIKVAKMPAILNAYGLSILSDPIRSVKEQLEMDLAVAVKEVLKDFNPGNLTSRFITLKENQVKDFIKAVQKALKGWEVDWYEKDQTILIYCNIRSDDWVALEGVKLKIMYEIIQ